MSGKEKVMAVLMGPVEVRQTFRDWPEKMCLAVCLMESGDCQLIVFHRDEAEVFPARLQAHLRLTGQELCFFPAVPGYASRSLLYSDERRLLSLVAEAPEIVEEASDYAVNYAFAQEEGLDPAVFLGVEAGPARAGSDRTSATPDPAAFVSCRGKSAAAVADAARSSRSGRVRKALLPGFMQRATPTQPGPRFRSARELALTEMPPVACIIRPEANGWILVERLGAGGADIRIGDPDLIYLRDDRNVVAIRLEPPWDMASPLPGRIWIRTKSLPSSLRMVFADGAGAAELTGSGAFLYLRPEPAPARIPQTNVQTLPETEAEPEGDQPQPDEPAQVAAAQGRKRRYRRRLLALTGIAAALVLMQVGMQLGDLGDPGSLGAEAPIDWDRFRSAWQAARAG
ncbi:hypothetical protein [Aquicoccus sp. SU-CL01552]|uniref:hypothetical protein n=1 Tax=Aquicoccus sp. SU-CL01552 TaxID=3127656 RepID=UPI003102E2A1